MTQTPVTCDADDVICCSSLVACDGSLVWTAGDGVIPETGRVEREVPVGVVVRETPLEVGRTEAA